MALEKGNQDLLQVRTDSLEGGGGEAVPWSARHATRVWGEGADLAHRFPGPFGSPLPRSGGLTARAPWRCLQAQQEVDRRLQRLEHVVMDRVWPSWLSGLAGVVLNLAVVFGAVLLGCIVGMYRARVGGRGPVLTAVIVTIPPALAPKTARDVLW